MEKFRGRWRWAAIAVMVAAASAAVATGASKALLGRAQRWLRARGAAPPRFDRLAASQAGYGPAMPKRFSAPREFASFRVLRETDGAAVLQGGAPLASVQVGLPGVDRAWIGDFTPLAASGRYRVVTDRGDTSFPFDVGPDAFDRAVRAVQRGFYFQRAFTAIDSGHAEGPWVHASDAAAAPAGVRMGWHDAGDYSVYSASLNDAVFWLLEAWADFSPPGDDTSIPESGNGIPDLLDEARWGLEWLLSVQDSSGGFRNTTCQEHYGRYGTNAPEKMPPYRNGEVGTLATARAAGNLAFASTLYQRWDASFASRCLVAALAGQRYLDAHPGETTDGPTCPAFRMNGNAAIGRQARMFAAAGLLLATGDARFRRAFEENYAPLDLDPGYQHLHGMAALLYLRARTADPTRSEALRGSIATLARQTAAEGAADAFGASGPMQWGTVGARFTRSGLFSVQRCLAGSEPDCAQALDNVHSALGRNALQISFIGGLPGVTRAHEHCFHQWLAALQASPYCWPGSVAGGPNPAPEKEDVSFPAAWPRPIWGYFGDPRFPRDSATPPEWRYTDNDSWSTNEVSIDWQATALYSLHFARWMAMRDQPSSSR